MRALLADFSGRTGPLFVGLLGRQLADAQAAAALAGEVADLRCAAAEVPDRLSRLGQDGGQARDALVEVLADTLTTPLDRADLLRVSRALDDISATLRDFLHQAGMFELADLSRCAHVLPAVAAALDALWAPLTALADLDPALVDGALAAARAGREVRQAYGEQLAILLHGPLESAMLMQRELLRRLDVVGLRVGEAAAALLDGFVKRR